MISASCFLCEFAFLGIEWLTCGGEENPIFSYMHADPTVLKTISQNVVCKALSMKYTGQRKQKNKAERNIPFEECTRGVGVAPAAVTRAAVLYVFRTMVSDDIPLNDGCLAHCLPCVFQAFLNLVSTTYPSGNWA